MLRNEIMQQNICLLVRNYYLCTMARHNELGHIGEKVAARFLMLQGYTIKAVDWHFGHKDLDLVAAKDGVTVFVEVKTRSTEAFGTPEEAVDNKKIRNLISAANVYIRRFGIVGPVRFDVISVVGECEPFKVTHFPNAFDSQSLMVYWR